MARSTHYTPSLPLFTVRALYFQAKELGIPMTQLANNLIEAGLKDSPGWKEAQEQMRLGEGSIQYQTNQTQ
jgi:hypothetical protein